MALELVSIHIPKTAGTSLMHSLYSIYGKDNVAHLLRKNVNYCPNDLVKYTEPNTKAILGHFFYSEIDSSIIENDNIKFVTFVRHPLDRLVSNYFHFIKEAKKSFPGSKRWFRQFESIIKYASRPATQNVLHKYLYPFNWDRFTFIGVQEQFSTDLVQMAKALNWDSIPEYELNVHVKKKELTAIQLALLTKWNAKDLKLYEEILKMKGMSTKGI